MSTVSKETLDYIRNVREASKVDQFSTLRPMAGMLGGWIMNTVRALFVLLVMAILFQQGFLVVMIAGVVVYVAVRLAIIPLIQNGGAK